MTTTIYANDKHAYIWVCYLYRLGLHSAGQPLTLAATSISKSTLRAQLFQARKHLEDSGRFALYHPLSLATRIKCNKLHVQIHPTEDFDAAFARVQASHGHFGRALNKVLEFCNSPPSVMTLNISNANLDTAEALGLRAWLHTQKMIRQAIVAEDIIILRK